jgi:ABC-type glutathione transport system ATPase component
LLGLASFRGPHLLILDEPTNHLDIDARAMLVEEINDYTGAVVLVSHDRVLLDACANRLWLVADGTVKSYDGDLDDYRRQVLSGVDGGIARRNESPADKAARKEGRKASAARRELAAPLRKQIKTLEAEIVRRRRKSRPLTRRWRHRIYTRANPRNWPALPSVAPMRPNTLPPSRRTGSGSTRNTKNLKPRRKGRRSASRLLLPAAGFVLLPIGDAEALTLRLFPLIARRLDRIGIVTVE